MTLKEKRVVRAAMRWYRSWLKGTSYKEVSRADGALFDACAVLASKKGKR
jgi:hypothetical protein